MEAMRSQARPMDRTIESRLAMSSQVVLPIAWRDLETQHTIACEKRPLRVRGREEPNVGGQTRCVAAARR